MVQAFSPAYLNVCYTVRGWTLVLSTSSELRHELEKFLQLFSCEICMLYVLADFCFVQLFILKLYLFRHLHDICLKTNNFLIATALVQEYGTILFFGINFLSVKSPLRVGHKFRECSLSRLLVWFRVDGIHISWATLCFNVAFRKWKRVLKNKTVLSTIQIIWKHTEYLHCLYLSASGGGYFRNQFFTQ